VFARALAASVCRTLRIDPVPVLQRLPQTAHPRLAQDRDGINTPFRPTGDAPRGGWFDQISRPVLVTVVGLLLGAVVLVFLPEADDAGTPPAASADSVMPPGSDASVTAAPAEPRTDALPADAAGAAPLAAVTGAVAASQPMMAASAAAPAAAPAAVAALAAASAATPPLASAGVVVFRTSGSSWVQVTDAKGTSVLRRLMEAGETVAADGALPLTVTVGNMQATEVQVRGQPYNLAPVSRDNVARFEVK
jgi:cytoskeleton protein RodZ